MDDDLIISFGPQHHPRPARTTMRRGELRLVVAAAGSGKSLLKSRALADASALDTGEQATPGTPPAPGQARR